MEVPCPPIVKITLSLIVSERGNSLYVSVPNVGVFCPQGQVAKCVFIAIVYLSTTVVLFLDLYQESISGSVV